MWGAKGSGGIAGGMADGPKAWKGPIKVDDGSTAASSSRSTSPTSRSTSKGPSETTVRLQIQQFLDDWHYNVIHSCVAKNWDRRRALRSALDLLGINGVAFPPHAKEELMEADEEALVDGILEHMPPAMQHRFEQLSQQLQNVLGQVCAVRRALEAGEAERGGEAEALHGLREVDDEKGVSRKIMRNAVVHASKEVAKTIDRHTSWRARTEARIERLQRATEDAERATQQWMATETQLSEIGNLQREKAKDCLMGLCGGQDQAIAHAAFSGWHGVLQKIQAESGIRQKFEAQLAAAEARLYKEKERRLGNVRAALARKAFEDTQCRLRHSFREWVQLMEDARRDGVTAEQLQQAQERLLQAEATRKANVTKVVARMCAGSVMGAQRAGFLGWARAMEELRRDRELEVEFKQMETKIKEQVEAQKLSTTGVLEHLGACSDMGLLGMAVAGWAQVADEERRIRDMKISLDRAGSRLEWLRDRQLLSATKVQARINRQAELLVCMRMLNGWLLITKAERVSRYFNMKLDNKRKQLNGVQNLFKTFAQQLEQGLGVEDGEDTSRLSKPILKNRAPHIPKKSSRGDLTKVGMQKGGDGTVSLPNIHQRPMWQEETRTRKMPLLI